MAIATTAEKNSLATKYGVDNPYVSLFTSAGPYSTAGTEFSGTRASIPWGAASNGVITATVNVSVPSGNNIQGVGLYSAQTAGTYNDGVSVTAQNFASAGTYQVTLTYTQS